MIIRDRPSGIKLFFVIKGSILPRVIRPLLVNVAVAAAVTILHGSFFNFKMTLTPIPFTLMGLALAIFLGFRNTAAYDRYWEGRKLWGQLVYEARNLARECQSLIAPQDGAAIGTDLNDVRTRMTYRAIAFAHALRQMLRGLNAPEELRAFLREDDWRALKTPAENLNILMRQMGRDLRECMEQGRIDTLLAASINTTLSSMTMVATGCERIKNTPIPFSYSLLLHRTAYLYCFLLPFGLLESTGYMTPIVVAIVAYTFFGLDALGDEIEEPFGLFDNDLPLDAICRTIESDLRKYVDDSAEVPALVPVRYRLT